MRRKMNGVLLDEKKILDYCGSFRTGVSEEDLPSEYTLPDHLIPDVRDQKTINSCVGFAITNVMQILEQEETGNRKQFSPGYVYGKCRADNAKYEGMYINLALDYLMKEGSCFWEDFPYNEEMPKIREMVNNRPDLEEKARPYKIKGYETYAQGDIKLKTLAIKKSIYENQRPIVVAADFPGGSHAVCIIGWNDATQKWKIVNSWGKTYGQNGIGNINYDWVTRGYLLVDEKNTNLLMPFIDVTEDKWYYKAVKHVYNAGFMNGTSENTFEPERAMTRAEVAQVMVNFAKKIEETYAPSTIKKPSFFKRILNIFKKK